MYVNKVKDPYIRYDEDEYLMLCSDNVNHLGEEIIRPV
jgi:hypothetical protein